MTLMMILGATVSAAGLIGIVVVAARNLRHSN